MKYLIKLMMDMIYHAPSKLKLYKKEHENEQVLAFSACKGIRLESEKHIERGINWTLAKRGLLILSDTFLTCDDWRISHADIEKAQLVTYRSGMVLKVTLKSGEHYQFGIQYEPQFLKQTALRFEVTSEKMKYSFFSVLLRVFIVVNGAVLIGMLLTK